MKKWFKTLTLSFLLLLSFSLASASTISVKDPPYNAAGDGMTDDTAAINGALTAAQAQRARLEFPTGDYLVSGSAAQLFLITRPSIEIFGHGMTSSRIVVSLSSSIGTDIFRLLPPASGPVPTGAWAMTENGKDNRGFYLHDLAIIAQSEPSLFADPYPSQPGRHAIHFDVSSPGQFLHNMKIERVQFGSFSGRAMYFNNLKPDGSWQNQDGIYQLSIQDCIIRNGILADYWGDSIRLTDNAFVGINPPIDSKQVPGATTLNIVGNNITNRNAMIIHNGFQINVERNIIELFVIPSAGSNGAAVDCRGDLFPTILKINFKGNIINTHVPANALDGIRLDNVAVAEVDGNSFNGQAGKFAVKTTAQTVNTVFGVNYLAGSPTFLLTNEAETAPIYRVHTSNASVGAVNGKEVRVNNFSPSGLVGLYLNSGLAVPSGGFVQYNNINGEKNLFVATGGSEPVYLGTNNTPRVSVATGGDLIILANGKGVQLRSPNGATCKRLGIDNSGYLVLTPC